MKLTLILSMLLFCGCNYKEDEEIPNPILIKINTDCAYEVKSPYTLIQWNDTTYGILFYDHYMNWYKVDIEKTHHHFTDIIEEGEHFKDSCEAKRNLKQFLDSRVTYKTVK